MALGMMLHEHLSRLAGVFLQGFTPVQAVTCQQLPSEHLQKVELGPQMRALFCWTWGSSDSWTFLSCSYMDKQAVLR